MWSFTYNLYDINQKLFIIRYNLYPALPSVLKIIVFFNFALAHNNNTRDTTSTERSTGGLIYCINNHV